MSGRSRQAKTDLPPKNRVMGSRRSPAPRARFPASEPVETVSETTVTVTKTVSGLSCWLSRDPMGEPGFHSFVDAILLQDEDYHNIITAIKYIKPNLAARMGKRRKLFRVSSGFHRTALYFFVGNNALNRFDPYGLFIYWGKYCGPGWCGGKEWSEKECACHEETLPKPDDVMDACCKDHDMCLGKGGGAECDDAICKCLDNVEPLDITPPPGKDNSFVYTKWRWMYGLFCGTKIPGH